MATSEVGFVVPDEYKAWIDNIKNKEKSNKSICKNKLRAIGFILGFGERYC